MEENICNRYLGIAMTSEQGPDEVHVVLIDC